VLDLFLVSLTLVLNLLKLLKNLNSLPLGLKVLGLDLVDDLSALLESELKFNNVLLELLLTVLTGSELSFNIPQNINCDVQLLNSVLEVSDLRKLHSDRVGLLIDDGLQSRALVLLLRAKNFNFSSVSLTLDLNIKLQLEDLGLVLIRVLLLPFLVLTHLLTEGN